MRFYAHTSENEQGRPEPEASGNWQPLSAHLRQVANMAREFGEPFGLGTEAELAGLLHDFGKYRDEFQSYLRGQRPGGRETQHAAFGAAWAIEEGRQLMLSAFAVAGHHSGLHDLGDLQGLPQRQHLKLKETLPIIEERFQQELGQLPIPALPAFVQDEHSAEVAARMLFSCLVDADRLDTACWPAQPAPDKLLDAGRLLRLLEEERDHKAAAAPESSLNQLRNRIFNTCVQRGSQAQGFFSLTVPTGGGKTLSAMAFALAHAKTHSLRRIIVAIPYLSIIEQNASEYRRIMGEEVVLENHSAIAPPANQTEEEKEALELASENWDAPVIVTTSVQVLESLFAASPSRCRKLHRMASSVVIFDEVQTLPAHLLQPVFSVFRELAQNYGVSFVFSSATQPAFRKSSALPDGFSADELREIAPEPAELFRQLRRVYYHLPKSGETLDWPELAAQLAVSSQVLCVVNLTRHAVALWEELSRRLPTDQRPFHLSAGMCPQHRLDLIQEIREYLRAGRPCRVISTQLIEAGVDVDFPVVWRALGPLDSIVQVAGRCNREGRLPAGQMHVFRPADHKLPPGVYQAASDQAIVSLAGFGSEERAAEHLASDSSLFSDYFYSLYSMVNTDYGRRGETPIQDDRKHLRFREVARKARVIPDDGQPVIVRYGAGAPIVEEIRTRPLAPGQPRFTRDDLRRIQRFMVNVRNHKFNLLLGHQLIQPLLPNLNLYVLNDGLYHSDLGLMIEHRPLEDFLL
ncbi:MAG: CRISPR-associated helicase Cas3' [Acidobacteria bacterium]|nr:CRISPR-associated helicase Cas3' [Acidobacteriota bacterium]